MDSSSQTFLVTGSSGFIGSRLVKTLLDHGHKIIGVDLRKSPQTNVQLDLSSPDIRGRLAEAMKGVDCVIHLAGLIRVGEGEKWPLKYYDVNVNGTYTLLEAMKLAKVKRIVFASSAAVYKPSDKPLAEKDPLGPVSVYGATKMAAEHAISTWENVDSVIFRFFNVGGGKEENPCHLIPIAIDKWTKGEDVHIFGSDYPTPDGTCVRDYFHVKDLIEAIELAISKWETLPPGPKIYNLGAGGKGYSVAKVCSRVSSACWIITGQYFAPFLGSPRPGDPAILIADISKAKKELGWEPKRTLADIIADTIVESI